VPGTVPHKTVNDLTEKTMKLLTIALGALLLALAVAPAANAAVPPFVVIRWAWGDCRIWHNVGNGPIGGGWRAVAFARTYPEAWAKMTVLYRKRVCV
jgi:hypothetical protein